MRFQNNAFPKRAEIDLRCKVLLTREVAIAFHDSLPALTNRWFPGSLTLRARVQAFSVSHFPAHEPTAQSIPPK